jgi:WD40 repeat protein
MLLVFCHYSIGAFARSAPSHRPHSEPRPQNMANLPQGAIYRTAPVKAKGGEPERIDALGCDEKLAVTSIGMCGGVQRLESKTGRVKTDSSSAPYSLGYKEKSVSPGGRSFILERNDGSHEYRTEGQRPVKLPKSRVELSPKEEAEQVGTFTFDGYLDLGKGLIAKSSGKVKYKAIRENGERIHKDLWSQKTIEIYQVGEPKPLRTLEIDYDEYLSAVDPTGKIAVTEYKKSLRFYRLGGKEPFFEKSAAGDKLANTVQFSPDGKTAFVVREVQRAPNKLYEIESLDLASTPVKSLSKVTSLPGEERPETLIRDPKWSVSNDGAMIAMNTEKGIQLIDAKTGKTIGDFPMPQGGVSSVAFCPDGSQLVTGGEDGTVMMWDLGRLLGDNSRASASELISKMKSEDIKAAYAAAFELSRLPNAKKALEKELETLRENASQSQVSKVTGLLNRAIGSVDEGLSSTRFQERETAYRQMQILIRERFEAADQPSIDAIEGQLSEIATSKSANAELKLRSAALQKVLEESKKRDSEAGRYKRLLTWALSRVESGN